MPTFPVFTRAYDQNSYSYTVSHDVMHTEFFSRSTRQRKLFDNHDVQFSANIVLSDSELSTFESFVTDDLENGSLTYTGPYYTSDVEYTGTLEIINGEYEATLLPPDHWRVSFNFELKDRDMTEEGNLYDSVISLGTFENMSNVLSALEDMVNNNTLS